MLSEKDFSFEGVNLYRDFAVVTAKTNSGKTTFAVDGLRRMLEEKLDTSFRICILLTPFKRTRVQILSDKRFEGKVAPLDETTVKAAAFEQERIEQTIVTTYAKLNLCIKNDDIDLRDCLLIFDELPRWISNTSYQEEQSYLLEYLLEDERWNSFVAIGMTGTPQLLNYCNRYSDLPFRFIDVTPNSELNIKAARGLFIERGSARTYAQRLIQEREASGTMLYVQGAKDAYQLKKMFDDAGYSAAFICSEGNEDIDSESKKSYAELMHGQIFDGLSILDWLDEKSDLPPSLDVFIINAAASDGINVIDAANRFQRVVVQSTCRMDIEQVRARIRHDIEKLIVIYSKEYEKTALRSLDDVSSFYRLLDENKVTLEQRYEDQREASLLLDGYKLRKNRAIADGSGESVGRKPETLDLVACKGKEGYFINPFIKALAMFTVDNYLYSSTHIEVVDNEEITTTVEVTRFDGRIKTIDDFIDELGLLLVDGTSFERMKGYQIKAIARNKDTVLSHDLSSLLDIKRGEERFYNSKDLKRLLEPIEVLSEKRNRASLPTKLRYLEPYLDIREGRKQVSGKRSRGYFVSLK